MNYSSDDWRVKCGLNVAYEKNITIIKKYRDSYYKLVTFNSLRIDGVELVSDKNKSKKGSKNNQKLLNNIVRAKNTIFELAMCNDWDFFITLTLSQDKLDLLDLDRYDLKSFYKYFSKWINHLPYKINYLIVPEKHKNGAWHFHGFISGIPQDELELFKSNQHLPKYILNKLNDNCLVYNWVRYFEKFGFCDLEYIKSQEKASSYITKYISKELYKNVNNLNEHCYYCSKGLKRAEKILKTSAILTDDFDYDFSNDYVSIKVLTESELESLTFI